MRTRNLAAFALLVITSCGGRRRRRWRERHHGRNPGKGNGNQALPGRQGLPGFKLGFSHNSAHFSTVAGRGADRSAPVENCFQFLTAAYRRSPASKFHVNWRRSPYRL